MWSQAHSEPIFMTTEQKLFDSIIDNQNYKRICLTHVPLILQTYLLKACVRYFFVKFLFFTKQQPFENYEKCFLFHLKRSFRS